MKIGLQEYAIRVNASPDVVAGFNDLPVRTVGTTTVYLKDIAYVRDGFAPQTNVVVIDSNKGALLPVRRAHGASTLDVVAQTRATLPAVAATLPSDFHVTPMFDQSVFVRAAVSSVVREAVIAAGLTGVMILIFLGSWRSTLIVLVSIPLSLLVSIIVLDWLGQTLNLMTLGGLALAVGILVDDATVAVENFDRQRAVGKPVVRAIVDAAEEIAVPTLVSTLCLCIVFLPVTLVAGAAKSLFIPVAMAVISAMLTSYFLSRTLVPTMMLYLLAKETIGASAAHGVLGLAHHWIEHRFEGLRRAHLRILNLALGHRRLFIGAFAIFVGLSLALVPFLGEDFFPSVDAGQHIRGQPGLRIEETQKLFAEVENHVRRVVPREELTAGRTSGSGRGAARRRPRRWRRTSPARGSARCGS